MFLLSALSGPVSRRAAADAASAMATPRMAPSSRIWRSSARAPASATSSGWRTSTDQVSVAGSFRLPVREKPVR